MRITVLVDNTAANGCACEWGLAAYIEYDGRALLLDTGASDMFASNAEILGLDLSTVSHAILSHAHYDHAGGYDAFFSINDRANLYVAGGAAENCFNFVKVRHHYIGIPRGTMEKYSERIIYKDDVSEISSGVFLIPHSTAGLEEMGRRNKMYLREGRRYRADDFCHEQTLVLKTEEGLVVLNSCSHSGPDVILDEVGKAFPNEQVRAYIGGLHLFERSDEEVRRIAEIFRMHGIGKVYTGHCTGVRALEILEEELGSGVVSLESGLVIEL